MEVNTSRAQRDRESEIQIITSPSKIQDIYVGMVEGAKENVMLVFPTLGAFKRAEILGILRSLRYAADKGIEIRIMTPEGDVDAINEIKRRVLDHPNIEVRFIAPPKKIREGKEEVVTILEIDRRSLLIMELVDDSKDSFADAIGKAVYWTNKINLMAYTMTFSGLWNETEHKGEIQLKAAQLMELNQQATELTMNLRDIISRLEVSGARLVSSEEHFKSLSSKFKEAQIDLSGKEDKLKLETSKRKLAQEKLRRADVNLIEKNVDLRVAQDVLADSNKKLTNVNQEIAQTVRELAIANLNLKVHNKMQKDFINLAAHELRTPIEALLLASELMLGDQSDDIAEMLHAIHRNALRLKKLSEDILDVARIESGTFKIKNEQISISELVSQAVDDVKPLILNSKLKMEIIDWTRQREEGKSAYVLGDRDRLGQVLSNVLHNAIRFTEQGSISTEVAVQYQGTNEGSKKKLVVITIRDTGSGINAAIMPRLFTKFATASPSGTGLGLYISKNIIESHGGAISADNNETGGGAKFTISLPLLNIYPKS